MTQNIDITQEQTIPCVTQFVK